ncbi:MAG TPA: hypothetical protein PK530_00945 [Anaerolineales bacterium]|nr:hypothetical protein [Anaerolineales bacterium]
MKNTRVTKQKLLGFAVVLLFLAFPHFLTASTAQASGTTRYVATTGSNTGNCTITPCRSLQYAVDQAASGDAILVAEGTYTFDPTVPYYCPAWTSAILCFVNKNLTILGGYSLANNWASRDPVQNPTILDGQNAHRGVVEVGYNTPSTYFLTMEGFTIQNAVAQGPTGYDTSGIGGGILVQHAAIILRDITFLNNRALGQNTSSGDGGQADGAAIRIESAPAGSTSVLQRVVFEGNQSIGGTGPDRGGIAFGALFVYDSTVLVEDATFTNNLAQGGNTTGNGISQINGLNADALGGAVAVENGNITLNRIEVTNNHVRGGNAAGIGGGSYGGGIFVEGVPPIVSTLSISDAYVANNTATGGTANKGGNSGGGGILATNTLVNITRAQVLSNTSFGGDPAPGGNSGPGGGGGIYLFSVSSGIPTATLSNMIIANNLAIQGNGPTQAGSLGNGGGGGIVIQGMNANMSHITFAKNQLDPGYPGLILGQAIGILPWYLSNGQLPATVTLAHSIVADHTVGGASATAVVVQVGTTLSFNQGLFAGNGKDTNADGSPVPVGTINGLATTQIAATAGFIAPDAPSENFHLRLDSPAKDDATTSSTPIDFENESRPYNGASDLGGDEYRPFSFSVAPGNGTLLLDWNNAANTLLAGTTGNYQVWVTCPAGANPPDQGGCGTSIVVGSATSFSLTGLSNYAVYTVQIKALDMSSPTIFAQSLALSGTPTDHLVYLPLALR